MKIKDITINESWPTFFRALDMLRKAKKFKHLPDDKLEKMAHEVAKKWDSGVKTAPKKTQHKVQDLTKQYKQDKQQMGDEEFFNYYGFSRPKAKVTEKWSQKYKDSIDCSNPKGFSQRAHCDSKKKTNEDVGSVSEGMQILQQLEETIRKNGSKWTIYSKRGRKLGSYDTKKSAKKRLKQIEYFKHMKEDYDADLPVVMSLIIEALDDDKNWNLDGNVNWDYVASDVWIAFEYKEMGYDDEEFNDLFMDAAERVAERFGTNPPYHSGLAIESLNEIGVKLSNYNGQVLAGDTVRAPKGFRGLEKGTPLKVVSINREGINKYKLNLEHLKSGKRYTVRNYEMDGEYKGKKIPKWSLVRKGKKK